MKRISIAAASAALFLAASSPAFAQGTAPSTGTGAKATGSPATATAKGGDTKTASSQLDQADRKFIENAALDGMKEVEAGKVMSGRATDPDVKAFADRMVKDHSDANKKLMDIAQTKGVTPPTELRKADRRGIDNMAKTAPDRLDKAYMREMVNDHRKDVRAFRKEAKNGKDADVKRFAADTLPVLEQHLKLATDTDDKVNKSAKTNTPPKQ